VIVVKLIAQLSAYAFLMVLASDLLFLYSVGGWDDPNKAILISELISLGGICLLGLWSFIDKVKELRRK